MNKSKIILPKVYEDRNGKYPQHKGKFKISYSQYTSYKDPEYQNDYYVQYFSGINLGGNVFSDFGGYCGTKIEHNALGKEYETPLLEEDLAILRDKIDYPDNCVYEDEICVDFGDFVCEGFIDRTWYKEDGVEVTDYKTLNIQKKLEFYASEEYGQTSLYCHAKEEEGSAILNSSVCGLGRKGTSFEGKGNYRIRLSGEVVNIPTPYSKERAEKVLNSMREVAHQISEDYKIYLKYFGKL
jgi:hypothetical protein